MKRISKFLGYIWNAWIPHRAYKGLVACHTKNDPVGNKILDDWMAECKGRMTPEAFEEYRRRVLESIGVERLRHTSRH